MKFLYHMFIVLLFSTMAHGQQLTLVTALHDDIEETSGLIYLNGKLITHNDSGGAPILYELDPASGDISRSVVIANATNTDWEDICYDSTYIYIADFGNNNGARTDLKIYRLLISDYLTTSNDTVTVDTILFSYLDQTNFTPSTFSTNFDAEAIFAYNNSLFIFTKNWGNNRTNIYPLPKSPGTYQIEKIDSIDAQGLITGATYDDIEHTLFLSGYSFIDPFIVEISDFTFNDFSNGTINRYLLDTPLGSSVQIEGISCFQTNQYYLTAETNFTGSPALYRLDRSILNIDVVDQNAAFLYPNPTSDFIELRGVDFSIVEIYDAQGILRKTSDRKSIRVSDLSTGIYVLVAKNLNGNIVCSKQMIVR